MRSDKLLNKARLRKFWFNFAQHTQTLSTDAGLDELGFYGGPERARESETTASGIESKRNLQRLAQPLGSAFHKQNY